MLKVTLHHSAPASVSARNLIGRLDIGYKKLDAHADYKAVMQTSGLGEHTPVTLENYPRWSASIWDLVARVACLCISRQEAIWPAEIPHSRKAAFIEDLTALIEHWPDGLDVRRATVATAHIAMRKRRCHYMATFEDDILGAKNSEVFTHTPLVLNPWDLLTRAYAIAFNGRCELPPRPELYTPIPVQFEGESYVPLETVSEPAGTGICRWLFKRQIVPSMIDLVDGICVTEAQFVEFLRRAV